MKKKRSWDCMDNPTSMLKQKAVIIESNYKLELTVTVFSADGIDDPENYPLPTSCKNYKVKFWVDSHPEPCITKKVRGTPDPEWKESFKITLDKWRNYEFLHVKVLRIRSELDGDVAGTSNDGDMISVGSACILLPNLDSHLAETIGLTKVVTSVGRFVLVRLEEKEQEPEGYITISMEMSYKYDEAQAISAPLFNEGRLSL